MNELLTVSDQRLDEMMTHEVGCESAHGYADSLFCSVEVTHRFSSCDVSKMLCATAASATQHRINDVFNRCKTCRRHIEDCWSVTPA